MLRPQRALIYTVITLLIGLACVVPFSGCGGGGGNGGNGGNGGGGAADVTGRVVDDGTLEGVVGAGVSVGGSQAIMGSNGFFTATGVRSGTVTFTVNAANYDTLNESRTLVSGSNNISAAPFFLVPTRLAGRGNVSGMVQTLGGASVGGAIVTIQASGGAFTGQSKTTGRFTVYNVRLGPGSVSAVGSRGEGTYGPVLIPDGINSAQQDIGTIRLTTGPPPPPPF